MVVGKQGAHTQINWHRFAKLAFVGIGTLGMIELAAFSYIRLFGSFTTIDDLLAFLGAMFPVTGAVIAVAVFAAQDHE